ncbi:MAG: DUF378 domain-containing protein [Planctomycetota bacterium]|jgi:uncharacterized membrane protein YuzA (DUF378 family)
MSKNEKIKTLDIVVWTFLTIGGLNWGLVGFFNFDLVATIFGEMSLLSRLVYSLVGLSAMYEIAQVRAISKRWHLHFHTPANA